MRADDGLGGKRVDAMYQPPLQARWNMKLRLLKGEAEALALGRPVLRQLKKQDYALQGKNPHALTPRRDRRPVRKLEVRRDRLQDGIAVRPGQPQSQFGLAAEKPGEFLVHPVDETLQFCVSLQRCSGFHSFARSSRTASAGRPPTWATTRRNSSESNEIIRSHARLAGIRKKPSSLISFRGTETHCSSENSNT